MSENICPQNKIIFDAERGEYICTETGEVIEDRVIDQGPEWRAFTMEEKEKRSRVGEPLNMAIYDKGISTFIDKRNKDATGKNLSQKARLTAIRWRKIQAISRIQSSRDRNLTQAMNELERIGNLLAIPKVAMNEASIIYRRALEKGLVRGRSIESVIAASIYTACRKLKIPRTLDEIAQYTKGDKNEIAKIYRTLIKELDIKVPIADPKDYVTRIGSLLGLSGASMKLAADILEKAKHTDAVWGRDPAGLAAAAIYIAGLINKEQITQDRLAKVAGVTEVTIRNRYRSIINALNIKLKHLP
ncbi:transcription initiation factor IIB [Sulfuracidifex metallicus]|uniref:transcription initiation factor IIB n=1 Tax=Sulfuracidifex metallicus TaxID=47303 RepID=UPI00227297B2|nr:transcription initiation factor IIB [Sulfuracidifex metallicus]MCY0849331.1 transcription initiation factor IIB [Sulfuracidifex metallicus]